jgi:endogenous inhibitor of DNA gyrase (YacG/DUF329 family)
MDYLDEMPAHEYQALKRAALEQERDLQCIKCPECGSALNEEVNPFSECSECERRVAEENRRNARPMDLSPASPLALRLAESMKDDRRAD